MDSSNEREKVIKGLEQFIADFKPFCGNRVDWQRVYDAIVLLKAQDNTICTKERCPMNASTISDDCNVKTCPWRTEAVVPRLSMSGLWYECPVCSRHLIKYEDNYCARCGKWVKWNV